MKQTCDIAKELLARPRCKQRYPVVLAACRGHRTRELPDTNEDGEIAEPDQYEAVDEACGAAAARLIINHTLIRISMYHGAGRRRKYVVAYFVKPMEKTLFWHVSRYNKPFFLRISK